MEFVFFLASMLLSIASYPFTFKQENSRDSMWLGSLIAVCIIGVQKDAGQSAMLGLLALQLTFIIAFAVISWRKAKLDDAVWHFLASAVYGMLCAYLVHYVIKLL